MIQITLLLCLIAVCLSGHYEEHSYGKMNTIELRSNDYHHIDEKRNILGGTSDIQSCDKNIANVVKDIITQIQNLLNKCEEDEGGIIVHLRDVVAGLLQTVLNLVTSLLGLVASLLDDIIDNLIDCNTDLKGLVLSLNDVLSQLTTNVNHIICKLVGTVDDIAGEITNLLNRLTPLIDQLRQLLLDCKDETLKTTVENLLKELDNLTTNLGTLVSQLLCLVLKLVAEILDIVPDAVKIATDLINGLNGKTLIEPEQISSCNTLIGYLDNLISKVGDLINQLVNPLPLGINLPGLLDTLFNLVNTILSELIDILEPLVASNADLGPVFTTLKARHQSLSQLLGQIPSS